MHYTNSSEFGEQAATSFDLRTLSKNRRQVRAYYEMIAAAEEVTSVFPPSLAAIERLKKALVESQEQGIPKGEQGIPKGEPQ